MKNLYKSFLIVLLISSFSALKGATAKKDVPIYTWNELTNIVLTRKFSKSLGEISWIRPVKGKSTKVSFDFYTTGSAKKSKTLGQPVKLEFTVSKRGNISYTITGNKYSSIKDKKNSKEGIWHSSKGAIKITAVMTMKGLLKNKPWEFNITFSEPTVAEIAKSFE